MIAERPILLDWLRPKQFCCALLILVLVTALASEKTVAQKPLSVFDDQAMSEPFAGADFDECETCDPDAAAFDQWETIVERDGEASWGDSQLLPFDYVRHFGFRHSSTHGPNVGRGLPLEGTSWLNRPYHIDWFSGSLLGDDLIAGRVSQDNQLFGGLRIGWDFDHYWGLETRFGWADPNVQYDEPLQNPYTGSYFVSDVDLVYYPWGDSKFRPYMLLGAGLTRLAFVDENARRYETTLATIPFGGGVQFRQCSWLAWRLELLDNLAIGADGVDTMHNVSLTAGMEFRFGSRPQSYWPWHSSRHVW